MFKYISFSLLTLHGVKWWNINLLGKPVDLANCVPELPMCFELVVLVLASNLWTLCKLGCSVL